MKIPPFPLFENLYANTDDSNKKTHHIDENFLQEVCEKLKTIDDEGSELVYAIIRYFQVYYDNKPSSHLPYGSKITKQGLKLDIAVFPKRLVEMLHLFLVLHSSKIQAEKEREMIHF